MTCGGDFKGINVDNGNQQKYDSEILHTVNIINNL